MAHKLANYQLKLFQAVVVAVKRLTISFSEQPKIAVCHNTTMGEPFFNNNLVLIVNGKSEVRIFLNSPRSAKGHTVYKNSQRWNNTFDNRGDISACTQGQKTEPELKSWYFLRRIRNIISEILDLWKETETKELELIIQYEHRINEPTTWFYS